jgi:hypothetical protein
MVVSRCLVGQDSRYGMRTTMVVESRGNVVCGRFEVM